MNIRGKRLESINEPVGNVSVILIPISSSGSSARFLSQNLLNSLKVWVELAPDGRPNLILPYMWLLKLIHKVIAE
jgi:hypothetical protein